VQANVVLRIAKRTIYYDTQGGHKKPLYYVHATPVEDEILGEIVSTGKNKM